MLPRFNCDKINIKNIKVHYDNNTSTKIKETTNLLQYESQHFRCQVKLEFHESIADHNWSVGLVQACDFMYLENRYGRQGSSFWEFHPLRSKRHTMVNDSDGRQYPFYSLTTSKCEISRGLVENCILTLNYEDHFYPTVAWELPYNGGVQLTNVIRKQDFWIWLIAIKRSNSNTNGFGSYSTYDPVCDKVKVLKTMRWRYKLHMTFDPNRPIGTRLIDLNDKQDELPYVLDEIHPIPISALCPPHCNAAQSLVWYPKRNIGKPKILVPPKQIIVPWETWCHDMSPMGIFQMPKPKDCHVVKEWSREERKTKNVTRIKNNSQSQVIVTVVDN